MFYIDNQEELGGGGRELPTSFIFTETVTNITSCLACECLVDDLWCTLRSDDRRRFLLGDKEWDLERDRLVGTWKHTIIHFYK